MASHENCVPQMLCHCDRILGCGDDNRAVDGSSVGALATAKYQEVQATSIALVIHRSGGDDGRHP